MVVSYAFIDEFPGWEHASELFISLIDEHGCKRILEIGSGANPTLAPADVQAMGITYVTSDANPEELEKADATFERMTVDLSAPEVDPELLVSFDAILSRMVNEHIRDGRQYHSNILKVLRPGGIAVHCFSTLWSLPFAVNRFLPDFITGRLLNAVGPRDPHQHAKFPAYYSWSRGPSEAMVRKYEKLGYEVLRYTGYFGHHYYTHRLPWLQRLEYRKARFLLKHPVSLLCSYATVVLRKPKDGPASP
jgi:SAM-dependent methyltransferase